MVQAYCVKHKSKKEMMHRKIAIIGALFLLGILLVASCSPKESSTTPTPPSTELPPSSYLPEVPRISAEEVKWKLDAGINLVIIDSRSKGAYDYSHIAGAVSIPLDTMAEPYSNLDGYDEIITYCT